MSVLTQMLSVQRKKYTGKAGTIVICDTSGFHRGGHVVDRDRYLYYSYYLTDGAYGLNEFVKNCHYRLESTDDIPLSPAADYAIQIWKKSANVAGPNTGSTGADVRPLEV